MKNGFTLAEMIVVLAIFALMAGLALYAGFDDFRASSFRSDRDLLVSLLQHARAQSVNNICNGAACTDGLPHGVHIDGGAKTYTVFQGATYTATDVNNQTFSEAQTVTPTGSADIIFTQLTGALVGGANKTVTLTAANKTSTITIEPSGRIWWTN